MRPYIKGRRFNASPLDDVRVVQKEMLPVGLRWKYQPGIQRTQLQHPGGTPLSLCGRRPSCKVEISVSKNTAQAYFWQGYFFLRRKNAGISHGSLSLLFSVRASSFFMFCAAGDLMPGMEGEEYGEDESLLALPLP